MEEDSVKWFRVDSNTPGDPFIRRVIRNFGNEGLGGLFRLWCFVAEHGKEPGKAIDSRGVPYRMDALLEASGLPEPTFNALLEMSLEDGHLDRDSWAEGIAHFPAMVERADEYTKRSKRQQKSLFDSGDDAATMPEVEAFIETWNDTMTPTLAKCQAKTPARVAHIRARLKERTLPEWVEVMTRIKASAFCNGTNDRGWKASIDWLIGSPDVAVKVLEGKYDNRTVTPMRKTGTTGAASTGKYAALGGQS